jgi:hypothetical protein
MAMMGIHILDLHWLNLLQIHPLVQFDQDHWLSLTIFLAKRIEDIDIIADMQQAWHHFVKSGQIWAVLIGTFFGYVFRSFTSY